MYGLNVSSSQTGGGIVVVVTGGGSLETSYFAFTKKVHSLYARYPEHSMSSASTVFVQLLKEVMALCVDGPIIPSTLIPTNL